MDRRTLVFVVVVALCIAGAGGYTMHLLRKAKTEAAAAAPIDFVKLDALPPSGTAGVRPFMLFRSTALGDSYGHVGLAYVDALQGQRYLSPLQCDRVHYASGTGVCLVAKRGAITTYEALLFDDKFATRKTFALAGPPSRARVSPDGRMAAFTVFVNGHGYSNPGFTTRTSVVDATGGTMLIEDLEALPVMRDGALFKAADFNFWGVTFARDGRRFFATLGTGGKTFLVEGDLTTRQLRVIQNDVECPSLSPDDTRVAFKRRQAADAQGRFIWRLNVLELASGKVTALQNESRNVDDQVEWLDSRSILYGMTKDGQQSSAELDVWAIAADGASAPRPLLPFAFSPAVTR